MIPCPMCRASVPVPDLDDLIDLQGMTGHPEAVLRAVWSAGGRPTTTERIFDEMYANDPEGGPSQGKMYQDLHHALDAVNSALAGTLQIVAIGNRSGRWRLRIAP